MYRLSVLFVLLCLILCLLLCSGCSTMPAVAVTPPRPLPITCLQDTPDALAPLPQGFDGLALEQQAKTILTLHASDGKTYQQVRIQLKACQQFIRESK